MLLSADILTTAAFAHGKDKESVPSYRDGEAGKELQMNMVKIVLKRLKEYSVRGRQDVFSNGAQWVAFARLSPFVTNVLTTEFGAKQKRGQTQRQFSTCRCGVGNLMSIFARSAPRSLSTMMGGMLK